MSYWFKKIEKQKNTLDNGYVKRFLFSKDKKEQTNDIEISLKEYSML